MYACSRFSPSPYFDGTLFHVFVHATSALPASYPLTQPFASVREAPGEDTEKRHGENIAHWPAAIQPLSKRLSAMLCLPRATRCLNAALNESNGCAERLVLWVHVARHVGTEHS